MTRMLLIFYASLLTVCFVFQKLSIYSEIERTRLWHEYHGENLDLILFIEGYTNDFLVIEEPLYLLSQHREVTGQLI